MKEQKERRKNGHKRTYRQQALRLHLLRGKLHRATPRRRRNQKNLNHHFQKAPFGAFFLVFRKASRLFRAVTKPPIRETLFRTPRRQTPPRKALCGARVPEQFYSEICAPAKYRLN